VILVTPSIDEQILAAAKRLEYGARQVVLVLLAAESFGGLVSSGGLAQAARRSGFTVRVVRYGDSITEALSSRAEARRWAEAA
jgi:hypothetical protein